MNALRKHLVDFFARDKSPSQGAVARAAGISRVALNRIAMGHSAPSLETAERIAIATGTALAKILDSKRKNR